MSVSVNMVAQKRVSSEELCVIEAWNALYDRGIKPSEEHRQKVREITGLKMKWDESVDCDALAVEGGYVEIRIEPEGHVEYGDGAVILMDTLPPGTFAIRVYMTA